MSIRTSFEDIIPFHCRNILIIYEFSDSNFAAYVYLRLLIYGTCVYLFPGTFCISQTSSCTLYVPCDVHINIHKCALRSFIVFWLGTKKTFPQQPECSFPSQGEWKNKKSTAGPICRVNAGIQGV